MNCIRFRFYLQFVEFFRLESAFSVWHRLGVAVCSHCWPLREVCCQYLCQKGAWFSGLLAIWNIDLHKQILVYVHFFLTK